MERNISSPCREPDTVHDKLASLFDDSPESFVHRQRQWDAWAELIEEMKVHRIDNVFALATMREIRREL